MGFKKLKTFLTKISIINQGARNVECTLQGPANPAKLFGNNNEITEQK